MLYPIRARDFFPRCRQMRCCFVRNVLTHRYVSILILIFYLLPFLPMAQKSKLDSLKRILPALQGISKADAFNTIANLYKDSDPDSSNIYSRQGLELSQRLPYKKGIGEAFRIMGWTTQDQIKKKKFYENALNVFKEIPYQKGIADTYNNLGNMYTELNDSLSLRYYDTALILYRKLGDFNGEGTMLIYSNVVYASQGNYTRAIDYALQGLDARKKTNNYLGIVYAYINAGNVYLEGEQYQSALNFFNLSISYAIEHGIEPMDWPYNQIGRLYLEMKDYGKAADFLQRKLTGSHVPYRDHLLLGELYLETGKTDSALEQFKRNLKEINGKKKLDVENRVRAMIGLSKTYVKTGRNDPAAQYAKRAYAISDSLHNRRLLADAALVLAGLYESENKFQPAMNYFRQAYQIKDSVLHEYNETFQRKLAGYQSKTAIETEQNRNRLLSAEKELQEQKLKNEKQLKFWILAASIVLILIACVVILTINSKRKQIQVQNVFIAEQKLEVENAFQKLKATQAQLIQVEKMASLGELTAGIAHEIQNPLNFVNNFAELNKELLVETKSDLEAGKISDVSLLLEDLVQNSEKILHHGKRAEGIVKGMLLHARPSREQKEFSDINAIAEEYLRIAYHSFQTKNHAVHINLKQHYAGGMDHISVVPQDIGRVLMNMYENAFYAVREKLKMVPQGFEPVVEIRTGMVSGKIEIHILDNGTGIPEKAIDKIFQPFFTTRPTGQGTGLGLSISYDIIKSHGGEINVNSVEGNGSEFIILLPLTK
jgi:two-component system NtrC family sensor kinase